jgi:PAS domain S-box-containing protein
MVEPAAEAASVGVRSRAPTGASSEAKLALAELLLTCDDAGQCASRSVSWLAEQGARQVLALGVDREQSRLLPLAAQGVTPSRFASYALDMDDRRHPLLAALFARRTALFNVEEGELPVTPLRTSSFAAVPLYGTLRKEDVPAGLLLVSQPSAGLLADARWLADIVGHRMVRLARLRTETETDRRLDRQQMLLNAVNDLIILTDTEGRMLIANTQAERLLATREGESEGRRRAVALNNMLFSSALAHTALQGGGPPRRELLLVDPEEGSDLLLELMSAVVSDPREGTGIVSILRNVTDLRRATEQIDENYRKMRAAEAQVRAERDRLDLIIDSVGDPILVTDPVGSIVLMNAPAERLFTPSEDAPQEEGVRIQANDAHFSSFVSNLFFLGEASRRRGDLGLVDPNSGEPLPMEAVSGKILSEHGELTGVVTILHDRTEQVEKAQLYEELKRSSDLLEERVRNATGELLRQNELLRRQRLELEQASAAKSQFLANMSHEFRTPLNAILGYTSLLLKGLSGPLSPTQSRDLSLVDSNARHLLEIINDILDISRIEAGRMPLHPSRFAVRQLVDEVLAELEPLIARSKLEIKKDVSKLPPQSADRPKVKQIILNLVTNALKFTTKGSVTISATRKKNETRIAVADTGIGIALADQEKIFEDFRQADSSPNRQYGGAGLGLSICRRLATMMGGRIELASGVGKGSCFTLVLPARARKR